MAEERLLSRPLVLCSLASLAQGVSFNLFLHLPGFLHQLGAGDVQIGFIFGITGASAVLARPPIGRAMDSRGRRGVILVGNVINTAVCALFLSVDAIGPWIYAIRVLHGVAEAMLFTALFTYAADWVPSGRRTQGLALFGVSGMLSMSLGGLLGDRILAHGSYHELFLAALGFAVLALVVSLPLRDHVRVGSADEEPSRGFVAALRQPDLIPLWWIGGVFAIALASVFAFLKRYVMETGLSTVGEFFSAYTGAAIFLRVFLGWLPDRIGPKRVLVPALLCLATAFLLLGSAANERDVVIAGALVGLGHGFTFPILFGMLVTRARDADRGSAMAIFTALFDLGVVVGGPLFGLVIGLGGFGAMFDVAACAVAAGLLVFVIWDRARRPGAAAPRTGRARPPR
jgi:MFS family permease